MNLTQATNFQDLYNKKIKDKNLSLKTAYKFNKILQSIESDLKFFSTKYQEIISTYCVKDGQGVPVESDGTFQILGGKSKECQGALNELYQFEVEKPNVTFTIDELEGLDLTVLELQTLMPFIE